MPKKHFLLMLVTSLLLLLNCSLSSTNINILVNNSKVYTDVEPFINNGTTYVPLRFISEALKTDSISWNEDSQSVTIRKGNDTLTFFINKNYAFINDSRTSINGTPIIKNSRTFVPLRIISENLNATVNWNEKTRTVSINTNESNSSNVSDNYDDDAVYWLARIIEAEASGEPYNGKVAVGEVILNRVKSNDFPNTIWGVIFDDNYGIQFEPVANGTIYNTPSSDSIAAAKEALSGSNYSSNSLYFLNPQIAQSNWITKNRQYCMTIANHDFYL